MKFYLFLLSFSLSLSLMASLVWAIGQHSSIINCLFFCLVCRVTVTFLSIFSGSFLIGGRKLLTRFDTMDGMDFLLSSHFCRKNRRSYYFYLCGSALHLNSSMLHTDHDFNVYDLALIILHSDGSQREGWVPLPRHFKAILLLSFDKFKSVCFISRIICFSSVRTSSQNWSNCSNFL